MNKKRKILIIESETLLKSKFIINHGLDPDEVMLHKMTKKYCPNENLEFYKLPSSCCIQ